METNKLVLVNIRGNMIPMTEEEYKEFLNDREWMDDMFSL